MMTWAPLLMMMRWCAGRIESLVKQTDEYNTTLCNKAEGSVREPEIGKDNPDRWLRRTQEYNIKPRSAASGQAGYCNDYETFEQPKGSRRTVDVQVDTMFGRGGNRSKIE
jgi:hypothetical protein